MAKDKKLESLINRLIKVSFTKDKLNIVKIKEVTKTLSTLSVGNAIKALDLYLSGLKKELDRHRLVIESPVKLSSEQIGKITDIIENSHTVYETEVIINPDLLAGFKIKIGDEIYEESLENRIAQLKEAIHD